MADSLYLSSLPLSFIFGSDLGSIPKELKSTTWVFPGEIRNPHSLAHSSIACNIICIILVISSVFFPDFQTALSSANCDRSTPFLISRASNFCFKGVCNEVE